MAEEITSLQTIVDGIKITQSINTSHMTDKRQILG